MAVRRLLDETTGEYLDVDIAEEQLTNEEAGAVRIARKAREKAEAEAAALRKETAFLRLGLDLEKPQLADFYKAYDGDLTPDAIRAAATARGYLGQPAEEQVPDSGSEQAQADQAAHVAAQRIASASMGSTPDLRSDQAKLVDAYAAEGTAGVVDKLREMGFAVAGENQ